MSNIVRLNVLLLHNLSNNVRCYDMNVDKENIRLDFLPFSKYFFNGIIMCNYYLVNNTLFVNW